MSGTNRSHFCLEQSGFDKSDSRRKKSLLSWAGVSFFHTHDMQTTFFFNLFNLLIFVCVGSSLLSAGSLQLWQAGATLGYGARASQCGGPPRCGARAPGARAPAAAACGLQSADSAAVAQGLSRSATCGILPDQDSNPRPPHWQADSQPLRHQGSPANNF